MTSSTNVGSTAARPDLDWSQVRETILMLNLALAQLEIAMHDSSGSVEVLSRSFTGMSGRLNGILEAVGRSNLLRYVPSLLIAGKPRAAI